MRAGLGTFATMSNGQAGSRVSKWRVGGRIWCSIANAHRTVSMAAVAPSGCPVMAFVPLMGGGVLPKTEDTHADSLESFICVPLACALI